MSDTLGLHATIWGAPSWSAVAEARQSLVTRTRLEGLGGAPLLAPAGVHVGGNVYPGLVYFLPGFRLAGQGD